MIFLTGTFTKRCDKLAFYGVESGGSTVFYKMQGFTSIATSKNPQTYTRRYVDEPFEQSDVVGYSPSVAYTFDRFAGNPVHDDIVKISDGELTGDAAVRSIIIVDMATKLNDGYAAVKRAFSVIPDTEGEDEDAYTYSGTMKVKGEKITGIATVTDNICSFTESSI